MPDTQRAERLLALFTSPQCAEGIVGDLAEERDRARDGGGASWYWRQGLPTMAALCATRFARAPLATLGLVATGCWIFAASAFVGVAAVSLFPQLLGSAVSWIVLSSLWWSGAFYAGASVVGVGQARGMAACVAVAMTCEALLATFGLTVLGSEALRSPSVLFYAIAGLAPVLLLAGGALQRFRMIASNNLLLEQ